jgi:hypothetical protein
MVERAIGIAAPGPKITSVLSNHGRRGRRRTEYACKWKDDTHPPANIMPTIISLVHVTREPALQHQWTEIVAEEAPHRELALLCVSRNRRAHISGIETDQATCHLPNFLPTVRSTLTKSGLHPLKGNAAETGHSDTWGLSVTWSSWMPQMTFAVKFQS